MTARAMDFNSDLGESYGWWVRGADEVMMTCISSANVACGFHAGDATVMRATVARALEHGVAIGAHPGYPDLLGFGRRALDVTPADTRSYVLYQLGALNGFVVAAGARLRHVKPHGALYMATLDDGRIAQAVVEAVAEFDDSLPVFTLAGSEMSNAAAKAGLQVGDIITKIGDVPVTTITSLSEALAVDRPGQKVTVTYMRDTAQRTADVTLGEI